MLKMKTMVWVWGLIGMLSAALTTVAGADVIYHQGLSENDNWGVVSNTDGDLSADNFVLSHFSSIQSITWYGMYESAGAATVETFDIRIFDLSGAQLFGDLDLHTVSKSYSGFDDALGEMIYRYDAVVAGWELPGDEYLLSISNGNSDFSNWYWADGLGGDGGVYYLDSGAWLPDNTASDMAFTLNGVRNPAVVPEPSSFLLLGMGLILIASFRRAKEMHF